MKLCPLLKKECIKEQCAWYINDLKRVNNYEDVVDSVVSELVVDLDDSEDMVDADNNEETSEPVTESEAGGCVVSSLPSIIQKVIESVVV